MRVDISNTVLAWRMYREQLDLELILILATFRQARDTGDTFLSSNISHNGPVSLLTAENAWTTNSVLNTPKTPCVGTSFSCIPSNSL